MKATLQINSRMFRLALCALVCLVALQTWETTHDHAHTGAAFECQVCSSPADLALPAPAAVAPIAILVGRYAEQYSQLGYATAFACFSPRAPPAVS